MATQKMKKAARKAVRCLAKNNPYTDDKPTRCEEQTYDGEFSITCEHGSYGEAHQQPRIRIQRWGADDYGVEAGYFFDYDYEGNARDNIVDEPGSVKTSDVAKLLLAICKKPIKRGRKRPHTRRIKVR